MSFKLAEAFVDIKANDKDLDSKLALAKGKLTRFADAMKSIAIPLGATLGVGAISAALSAGVKAAGDFNESVDKSRSVLGAMSAQAERFADSMQGAFGNDRRQMLDSVAGFAMMAKATGTADKGAVEFGQTMTRLADDASSLFNTSFSDAFQKIRSGLAGESEPLRAFNVFLSESAVQAKAAEMGYSSMGGALSEAAKISARAALIQQGLASAMGNHAQTQGSYNNQIKEFTGRVDELKTAMGQGLIPVLNEGLKVVNPLIQGIGQLGKEMAKLGEASEGSGLGSVWKAITGNGFGGLSAQANVALNWRNAGGGGVIDKAGLAGAGKDKLAQAGDVYLAAAREALDRERQKKGLDAAIDRERTKQGIEDYKNRQKALDLVAAQGVPGALIPTKGGGMQLNSAFEGIGARMEQRNKDTLDQIRGVGGLLANVIGGKVGGALGLGQAAAGALGDRLKQESPKGVGGISDVDSFNRDLQAGALNQEKAAEETATNTKKAAEGIDKLIDILGKARNQVVAVLS